MFALLTLGCSNGGDDNDDNDTGSDGPAVTNNPNTHATGNATAGRTVFREATFRNEGFWTDAARLPQGLVAANISPLDALELGLSVDVDALDTTTQGTIAAELLTDLSPTNAPFLNDTTSTVILLNRNAIVGIVPKDTNQDGVINVFGGDRAGVSCALCHSTTDGTMFAMNGGGSIGHRVDGRTPHDLDFGRIASHALNSRALYPLLQLSFAAHGNATIGRAPTGLNELSSEAEVDAYLSNPQYYPVGMFDLTFDGSGDPTRIMPLFRADLAAPWGSGGDFRYLDNFTNLIYTAVLDPTNLTSPGGRDFLENLLGDAGTELVDEYVQILAATNVTEYPFVDARRKSMVPFEQAPLGLRVDENDLLDLNAYLNNLQAPAGDDTNPGAIARGRDRFRQTCTQCHRVDQGVFVPPNVYLLPLVWPGDAPVVIADRPTPLTDILDSPGTFDDRLAVINASLRGFGRGVAMPLLLDLKNEPNFLHDGSVATLEDLLDPTRGVLAPHPFYEPDRAIRGDLVAYLESLDTASH